MKPPLSDTLVICDMDNTLLTAKEGIPACNRAVIQLYTGMGGFSRWQRAARRSPSARRWGHPPVAAGHLLQRGAAV